MVAVFRAGTTLSHNPTTITTPVSFNGGAAVFGGPGTAWNLVNLSSIKGIGPPIRDPIVPKGYGVVLADGGIVTNGAANAKGAEIFGSYIGVYFESAAAGRVTNFGTIAGGGLPAQPGGDAVPGWGVVLGRGGAVSNGSKNATGASISGYDAGVDIVNGAGRVTNFGKIAATSSALGLGASLGRGGVVTNGAKNATGASISGGWVGVDIESSTGRVTNFGTIAGVGAGYGAGAKRGTSGNYGVYLGKGGAVTNFGVIRGETGVQTGGSTTLTNSGTIVGTGGAAVRLGGGNDVLTVKAGASFAGRVTGGGGTDKVVQGSAGVLRVTGFTAFETFSLAKGGAARLTLTNANFAGVTGAAITIDGGSRGNTVDASALTGKNRVIVVGGAGKDSLIGGAGSDVFRFSAASLGTTDILKGGGGSDQLNLTATGTVRAKGVSGVETYVLANGGGNVLTLASANFAGMARRVITVVGGNAGDRLSEAAASVTGHAVLRGGGGADRLVAGWNATLNGGSGNDVFVLTTPGSPASPDRNTIADFTHNADKIALSEKGFALGRSTKATSLFTANKTGKFTSAAQRFAYDTTHGRLFYDAHGNAAHSSHELIATLAHSPTLTAGDITFFA